VWQRGFEGGSAIPERRQIRCPRFPTPYILWGSEFLDQWRSKWSVWMYLIFSNIPSPFYCLPPHNSIPTFCILVARGPGDNGSGTGDNGFLSGFTAFYVCWQILGQRLQRIHSHVNSAIENNTYQLERTDFRAKNRVAKNFFKHNSVTIALIMILLP
jgi:hypothetical protein